MTTLQIALVLLSVLVLKSSSSPIASKSEDEKWLRRSKLSGGEGLWKQFASKQFKSNAIDGLSDGEAVKLLDPRYRESLNKMLTKMNSQHQKPTNENEGGSKSVQSFYPKCDAESDAKNNKNEKQLLGKAAGRPLPLYYDLHQSLVSKPANVVLKSNLRVYLKDSEACECKSDAADDDILRLSLHEMLSRVSFLPFKEVSKKQHIQTIKFNRCCDQLITFDVTKLVQKWKLYPDSNHGILLELTDELGNKFNVDDYIQTMNCADLSLPMPYIKMLRPNTPNLAKQSEVLYPTLDVAFNRNDRPARKSAQVLDDDRTDKDAGD